VQEVVLGDTGVTPRQRFDAATRNHPHRARTSNASTRRELRTNRRAQKNAGKRAVSNSGAGGRGTCQELASCRRQVVNDLENGSANVACPTPLTHRYPRSDGENENPVPTGKGGASKREVVGRVGLSPTVGLRGVRESRLPIRRVVRAIVESPANVFFVERRR
jgi:hypothetical protein